ncbi:DUF3179 domain-containing (seleno)protein [Candidatus Poriferisodalis sp.]|uniref:DUF3179 domain-containing (seleno)protein n=1 Tax=Candidatus Poriferisodalis sp. TaxID=3101277 RepID=UPI003C701E9E
MRFRFFAPLVGAALLAAACAGNDTTTPTSAMTPTSVAGAAEEPVQEAAPATTSAGISTSEAGSSQDAVLLDPRETGSLRNHLGYAFPLPPEVPTGPIAQTAVDDLEFIWSGFQTEVNFSGLTVARLAQSGDPRLAWILSDLLRFFPRGDIADGAVSAFQSLTGARLADDPVAARSPWQSVTDHLLAWDLPAFDGYDEYKERLFTLVEPGWQPFFDDADADIDWRIVSWGGVLIDNRQLGDARPCPRGCIPALDDPAVTDASAGSWYPDDGIVFAVVIGDETRAYPRHIMEIHEMVNDTLGGRRIGMPYCTLCGSAQAYLTDAVPDGVAVPVLRTSGLLSRSNKVMYDLVTKSVFNTFTGRAVSGPLREQGIELPQATVVTTTWGKWKVAHPDTTIVARDGGTGRQYPFNPLGGRDDHGPIFPVGDVDGRRSVHDQVFGVVLDDGTPVAFPVAAAMAALEAGGTVELGSVTLHLDGGGLRAVDAAGAEIEGHQSFWFAWSQFMADTLLWEP